MTALVLFVYDSAGLSVHHKSNSFGKVRFLFTTRAAVSVFCMFLFHVWFLFCFVCLACSCISCIFLCIYVYYLTPVGSFL